ncbi:hypothetical protein LWC35_35645 [Pseudonocardia kujensis]|uniref:hypothetical protein n=1 Tax=Pseudonocardia kujensis TaxID=1128675 RepID=UPI001E3A4063|nr:hypothetical protein [Pseudonocardia kujensis]MCE0768192.1 hypothetical protein [Pseudonocardia kujensis]
MLKKAGIVATGVAASLVAVSPLAFAGDKGHDHDKGDKGHHGSSVTGIDKSGKGLLNVSGNNVNVPVQVCNNDVPVNAGVGAIQGNAKDITGALTGALGLFGKAKADTDVHTDSDRSCGLDAFAGDKVG